MMDENRTKSGKSSWNFSTGNEEKIFQLPGEEKKKEVTQRIRMTSDYSTITVEARRLWSNTKFKRKIISSLGFYTESRKKDISRHQCFKHLLPIPFLRCPRGCTPLK